MLKLKDTIRMKVVELDKKYLLLHVNMRKLLDTPFSFVPYKSISILDSDIYNNFLFNLSKREEEITSDVLFKDKDMFSSHTEFNSFLFTWGEFIKKEIKYQGKYFNDNVEQKGNILIDLFIHSLEFEGKNGEDYNALMKLFKLK